MFNCVIFFLFHNPLLNKLLVLLQKLEIIFSDPNEFRTITTTLKCIAVLTEPRGLVLCVHPTTARLVGHH